MEAAFARGRALRSSVRPGPMPIAVPEPGTLRKKVASTLIKTPLKPGSCAKWNRKPFEWGNPIFLSPNFSVYSERYFFFGRRA